MAILLDAESNEEFASVFWTDGRFLFSADSSSLTHVLQFEQYRMMMSGSSRKFGD